MFVCTSRISLHPGLNAVFFCAGILPTHFSFGFPIGSTTFCVTNTTSTSLQSS